MAGVINKIRSKGTLLLVIILLAMSSFVLTDILSRLNDIIRGTSGPSEELGVVAGEKIKYEDFYNKVQSAVAREARNNPDAQMDDFRRNSIAGQVWEQTVNEKIFEKEYASLGITVSDKEFQDMLMGPDADPQVLQWFGSRENIPTAWKNAETNPQLKEQLKQIEDYLINNRKQTKYNTLIKNGLFVSKAEATRKNDEENKKYNISFLAINYGGVPDSVVNVKESDYDEYYREHIEEFKQNKHEAVLKYVTIPKKPTRGDTLSIRKSLEEIQTEFANIEDDSIYAASKSMSAQKFPSIYQNPADLDSITRSRIAGVKLDSVVGPFQDAGTFKLIKVADRKMNDTVPFLKLRHILIIPKGNTAKDTAEANGKAMVLKTQVEANRDGFGELASKESQDDKTKFNKGEIGWYQFGTYGGDFDKQLKSAKKGQILAPLKSNRGIHVVEVLDKSSDAIRLAIIAKDVEPGSGTIDSLRKKSAMILNQIKNVNDIDTVAKKMGLQAQTSQPLSSGQYYIPGLQGSGIAEIVRWGLKSKDGTIAESIFEVDNALVIPAVVYNSKMGYKSLAQIKDQIKTKVVNKLKGQYIQEKFKNIPISADLEKIKQSYGGSAFVSKAQNVTFQTPSVPGIGFDPKVVGNIFKLKKVNDFTPKPIIGNTGVYIVKIDSIAEPQKLEDKAMEEYKKNLQASRRSQFSSKINQGLRENAKVEDNRYNFSF